MFVNRSMIIGVLLCVVCVCVFVFVAGELKCMTGWAKSGWVLLVMMMSEHSITNRTIVDAVRGALFYTHTFSLCAIRHSHFRTQFQLHI